MHKKISLSYPFLALILFLFLNLSAHKAAAENSTPRHYRPYLDFLEKVYQEMEENYHYFHPASKKIYRQFVKQYEESVLEQLPPVGGRVDPVAYRGAGLLVMRLRHPDDTFTNFIPPAKAKEFSQEAYGRRHDIGITGHLAEKGYLITRVEKRSDSYLKGIRPKQIILEINSESTLTMSEDEIEKKLTPELDTTVVLAVFDKHRDKTLEYEIISKEYFRETIEIIPTEIDNAYCLKIKTFNRKTALDLKEIIKNLQEKGEIELLIIDIRGNPGGPPLAIREMSGIFIPPEKKLVYYQRRSQPVAGLMSSSSEVTYDGPLAVLIDSQTGSSSELLAVLLKEYSQAQIVGKEATAGSSFLKGVSEFEDESMLIMITGFAYLFDGTKLSMEGIPPTLTVPKKNNVLEYTLKQYKNGNLF